MAFDFREKLVNDDGEVREEEANKYVEELEKLFADSPEAEALRARGIEPPEYLTMFLDYALRYTGVSPAEMTTRDIYEALSVFAQKVAGPPEQLDNLIPELEAFCDFVQRVFGAGEAGAWKRAIQRDAAKFRRAVRDPRHWGMAKSMVMEGMARGYDLSSEESLNNWMQTLQTEQLARMLGAETPAESPASTNEGDSFAEVYGDRVPFTWETGDKLPTGPYGAVSPLPSKHAKAKTKAKRKQSEASRRRNRRR